MRKSKTSAKGLLGIVVIFVVIASFFALISGGDDEPTTTEPQSVQAVASESQPAPTTEAETEKTTEKQTQPKSQTYMLNENTGKYHRPSCSTIKDSTNLREISAEEAKNYSPCGRCKP